LKKKTKIKMRSNREFQKIKDKERLASKNRVSQVNQKRRMVNFLRQFETYREMEEFEKFEKESKNLRSPTSTRSAKSSRSKGLKSPKSLPKPDNRAKRPKKGAKPAIREIRAKSAIRGLRARAKMGVVKGAHSHKAAKEAQQCRNKSGRYKTMNDRFFKTEFWQKVKAETSNLNVFEDALKAYRKIKGTDFKKSMKEKNLRMGD
jgi:hypothetical protein